MILPRIYRWVIEEEEEHVREKDVFWVTDLIMCPAKRYFALNYPELEKRKLFEPKLMVGKIVHAGVESLVKSLFSEDYSVEIEVEGEKRIRITVDNTLHEVKVRGRIDAFCTNKEDPNKAFGVEVKYTASYSKPPEHHILQAKIYNWLFDLDKTYLLYVSPSAVTQLNISSRVDTEFVVDRVMDYFRVENYFQKGDFVNFGNFPTYDWECKYCPFAVICPFAKR